MAKKIFRLAIVVLLLVVAGVGYISTQHFEAPSQPVSQELPRETFISAQ